MTVPFDVETKSDGDDNDNADGGGSDDGDAMNDSHRH